MIRKLRNAHFFRALFFVVLCEAALLARPQPAHALFGWLWDLMGWSKTGQNDGPNGSPCDPPQPRIRVGIDPVEIELAEQFKNLFGSCAKNKTQIEQLFDQAIEDVTNSRVIKLVDVGKFLDSATKTGVYIPSFVPYYEQSLRMIAPQKDGKETTIPIYYNGGLAEVTSKQFRAIDGVARTIWGEVGACPHQMEAVGRVINDRVRSGNKAFIPAKCNDPRLLPAEKVVACDLQFSNWDSPEALRSGEMKKLVERMPEMAPKILEERLRDRNRAVLCPKIEGKVSTERWQKALELAKMIVLDSKGYEKRYQWASGSKGVYMFTHFDSVRDARKLDSWRKDYNELAMPGMRDTRTGINIEWRGDRESDCAGFRLWAEKSPEERKLEAAARQEAAAKLLRASEQKKREENERMIKLLTEAGKRDKAARSPAGGPQTAPIVKTGGAY